MQELKEAIKKASKDLFGVDVEPELTRPEEQFGDFATNVALQLAGKVNKKPAEIAEQLMPELKLSSISKTEIAGPGFINFWLSDQALAGLLDVKPVQKLTGQEILVEFGDPNPFKEMHIGHLYSYIVGDSISRLLESSGATVKRLSYHGDVGLHVAKAIWSMRLSNINMEDASSLEPGSYYAHGAKAYAEDENAKNEIEAINEHIYNHDDEQINTLYQWGKDRSFEYFKNALVDFNIKSDKQYLESQSGPIGVEFVRKHTGTVFKKSDGAVIYDGEKAGLHTRVFITSRGLPTYETKDLGLAELKNQDYPSSSRSIIITAHEQTEYFKVMLAALKEFDATLATKTTHLSHGFVSLSSGKMSSRTGDVYGALDLLGDVQQVAKETYPNFSHESNLAAIKYSFLRHRLGTDITYDIEESVSLEGNSGPYVQYAHARARSIMGKVKAADQKLGITDFEAGERSLARKISEYPEVVEEAVNELMPHHVATYLYELAQTFNRFYESNRVVGDPRENVRLRLVKSYADVLKNGLELLNISAPEKM